MHWVGQSTAAAQVLFVGAGAVMLTLGIALAAYAESQFGHTVFTWAGYSLGWWGSTFPVGTYCRGSHLLAQSVGLGWLNHLSQGLLAHWGVCVLRWATWLVEAKGFSHRVATHRG